MVNPSFLIIPGAWQTPPAFKTLQTQLTTAGFDATIATLPSVGVTTSAGLTEDTAVVQSALDGLVSDGKEVVVYCHSYGGAVGSNAVKGYDVTTRSAAGKTGGVKAIVYVSAFMLPSGSSVLDLLGGEPLPWMIVESDRVVGNTTLVPSVAFNDLSADEATYWTEQLTWTSLTAFTTPSNYTPWTEGIPTYYIYGTEDNALPLSYQTQMAAQLPEGSKTASEPSAHCAHLSRPANVTEILTGWFGSS